VAKKKTSAKAKGLGLYANLTSRAKTKKTAEARKKAEHLAKLPKDPVKRFFYRLRPKYLKQYWFSKRGAKMLLKIIASMVIALVIAFAGLFLLFRKDLDAIRPGELAKRVQSTVNTYTDRNGKILWEDKGDGNYKLVVDGNDISTYMRQATVAIEDKDFYKHHGVSWTGLARSLLNNLRGGSTQGGSTLTQQLIKQVYFSDQASNRGLGGIPRKIKEIILSLEIERMYDKEQIITLYLNESPYGGRRNGVESGAQTYFGKSAKDLTLAESALLAAIPNNPSVYNPYNIAGNELLIERQHKVLDDMVTSKFITKAQAEEAKKVNILDQIRPESDQYKDMKAPHFVQEVKRQLEKELGVKTVGAGGLTIKTTLDLDAQNYAEQAISDNVSYMSYARADNTALASIDVKTGQVIAMVGSVNYDAPGFGQTNAATSLLEPGSSIKPIADYSTLFKQRSGVNYGPGSILRDENINSIYCAGAPAGCSVSNFTGKFYGDITIRQALSNSLNIPAIKAMYISGVDASIKTAHDLGDLSYCTDNNDAGLSAAIGGGCSVTPVEHANAYASLARGGKYLPLAYVLEVKNSNGDVLKKWEAPKAKQAIDPQIAYMLTDILHDPVARASLVWGSASYGFGFVVPGVWTATKSGTTDNGSGHSKDLWFMSYSTSIATAVWEGNHDGSPMLGDDSNHIYGRHVINEYMENVHKNVYAKQGKWKSGDAPTMPSGIQKLTINGKTDIWPSWYNKNNTGVTQSKMTFDTISRKKATSCTPQTTRIDIEVTKVTDPVTKKDTYVADGYDTKNDDDVHKCSDRMPNATVSFANDTFAASTPNTIQISLIAGTFSLKEYYVSVDGTVIASGAASSNVLNVAYTFASSNQKVAVRLVDTAGYENTVTAVSP